MVKEAAPALIAFPVMVPVAVREPTVVDPMRAELATKEEVAVKVPMVSAPVLSEVEVQPNFPDARV